MRPIDANELIEAIKKYAIKNPVHTIDFERNAVIFHILEAIYATPTLDYGPVIHAHWIPCVSHCECSRCHNAEEFCEPHCHCGAKMDEKEGEQNATD